MVDAALIALAFLVADVPIPAATLEHVYTDRFYAALNLTFVPLANRVPFAVGDLETVLVATLVIGGWIVALRRAREPRLFVVLRLVAHTLAVAAAITIAFNLLWGWNYRRAPVATRIDFEPPNDFLQTVYLI